MASTEPRQNKMGVMPIPGLLLSMAVPLVVSLLVQSLYNIVDSIFVARLSERALTATSLAYPVQILMIALAVGSGVGVNALLSRLLGQGKRQEVGKAAATGLVLALLCGVLFSLLGIFGARGFARIMAPDEETADLCGRYLTICLSLGYGVFVETMAQRFMQASGKTFLSMISLVTGALTNIILDPIMIFGLLGFPALGIEGAAIATVIGQWVGAAVALILNRAYNPEVPLSLRGFRLEGRVVLAIYRVGLPTILMQTMGSIMNFGMNAMLSGAVGGTAVAFFGAYYKLQNFLFMPMNGLGQACLPIVAFNFGAGKKERIRETIRMGLRWGICIGLLGTALFLLLPGQLLGLFDPSEEMLGLGVPALRILSATYACCAVTTILGLCGAGLGNGLLNMAGTGLRQVFLLLPAFALLLKGFGLPTAWYASWLAEGLAMLFVIWGMRRELNKGDG